MSIRSILIEAQKERKLVAMYVDPSDQTSCSVGLVHHVDTDWYVLKSFDTIGADDGFELRKIEHLYRVDVQGPYEKKIDFLRKHYLETFRAVDLHVIDDEKKDFVTMCLEEMLRSDAIVYIWTEDEEYASIGYVRSVEDGVVMLQTVDDFGRIDSDVYIEIGTIEAVDFNPRKSQVTDFLCKNKKAWLDE
ncbi:hypothetical protein [Oceanidesulfovibrio marinus]|uniref:Uncharacterized protein n=1 Tax=Oceanidesulfovibrio marinus TaxID=370038 RepID=A0A6P1ZDK0_9BACT|nr:hypothetical protein [Oceanidesulfovibrio marinus]QJT10483.1 hypothetical protein E8L03_16820 [Oceanidesulfovibrio marinus]TVM30003.1 hypothetical protein DQK91_21755 [Oceanidesulfovibrio marinus]